MCGIIGGVSNKNIVPNLLDGLTHLEYRGYDSAGIAVIDASQSLRRLRTTGKIEALKKLLEKEVLAGNTGIAHTRWATHGVPSVENAHPHMVGNQIALVHNGIIENHHYLRQQLIEKGCQFSSQTDTELIAHLIYIKIKQGQDFLSAVRNTEKELEGAYAIGVINQDEPGRLIAIRNGSPLVIGKDKGQNFIASDPTALSAITQTFIYLEDGDLADITADKIQIYDSRHQLVARAIQSGLSIQKVERKGKYPHYMLKEIFEQPQAITSTLEGRISKDHVLIEMFGETAPQIFKQIKRIKIVACGTSYYAGLVGRNWLEELARVPCQVEIASENRYNHHVIEPNTLFVTLSQSGETADTLAALRLAKKSGYAATLTICNVAESSIVRESELIFITNAGKEIGVASTKSFMTQITALFLLTLTIMRCKEISDIKSEKFWVKQLQLLPQIIQETLGIAPSIKNLAQQFIHKKNALFLARGLQLPIAMEGALKLKEISYIHAEAFSAGELKHGPLALVDDEIAIIALMPNDDLCKKMESNLEEVLSRHGKIIVIADDNTKVMEKSNIEAVFTPSLERFFTPFTYVIPLQLLAYYVALLKGNDVDRPRNLAKSVTVE